MAVQTTYLIKRPFQSRIFEKENHNQNSGYVKTMEIFSTIPNLRTNVPLKTYT